MSSPSLKALASRFYRLRARLVANAYPEPGPGVVEAKKRLSQGRSFSGIERVGNSYHYVLSERGDEFERRVAEDSDRILYWLISDLTFSAATVYELHNRRADQDFRRQLFAEQLRLLGLLRPDWEDEMHEEMAEILNRAPFNDGLLGNLKGFLMELKS